MGDILLGLLIGVIGLLILCAGYRFARLLLPLWGFISGFMLGASLIADSTSSTLLGSLFGIVVGLVVGLLFALLIYAYYYLAIVLLGAATGYWLGVSFIALLGIDPGFLTAITGVGVGILFALAAIVFNFPRIFLITMTAIGGAVAVVAAGMLIFNVVSSDYLSYSTVAVAINNSFFWWIATFTLFIVGVILQSALEKNVETQQWNMLKEMQAKKLASQNKKTAV